MERSNADEKFSNSDGAVVVRRIVNIRSRSDSYEVNGVENDEVAKIDVATTVSPATISDGQSQAIAAALRWENIPHGAIAQMRWNPNLGKVEVAKVPNLTPNQEIAIKIAIESIQRNVAKASKDQGEKDLNSINPGKVLTIY